MTRDELAWLFDLDVETLERESAIFSIASPDAGERLFPAYQFEGPKGRPLPIVGELCRSFRDTGVPQFLSLWLEEPSLLFRGASPSERLTSHPEEVLASARLFLKRHRQFDRKADAA